MAPCGRRIRHWVERVGLSTGLAGLLAVYAVGGGPEIVPPSASASPVAPTMVPVAEGEPIRQTEPEAVAHAAEIGQRVAIGAFRTESRDVYVNPDGTRTAVEHVRPVRVVQNGRWTPTDPTLVRGPGGVVGPRAAVVGMRISGGGAGPFVRLDRAGRELSLGWPGPLPEPVVDGRTATYSDVLPGVDLVINADIDGVSHLIVVKTPEAARQPELARLTLPVDLDGLALRETPDGGIEAVEPSGGGVVFEAAPPLMWDSGASATGGTATGGLRKSAVASPGLLEGPGDSSKRSVVDVEVGTKSLTLVPDSRLLTDSSANYPLYIDPVWKSSSRSYWTMVASGYPNEIYSKFDGKLHEGVGQCPVSSGQCNGVGIKRLFYAIPTSAFKGKSILSAQFRVTLQDAYDSTPRPVQLYQTGAISSSTKWSNQPAWSAFQDNASPSKPTGICTNTNQNAEFDAITAVRAAASKGSATTTFGLRAHDESDDRQWKRFCSNALLEVRYNTPPSIPAQKELTSSPGGSCVNGSAAPYVSELPRLNAVLRDPDHKANGSVEKLNAEFKVSWKDPNTGAVVERSYTTSQGDATTTFTYRVPTDIPQNVVVSWQVRASDGIVWGSWSSAACQFIYDKTAPSAPVVTSVEFPSENESYEGVGRYATFKIKTASTDVFEYQWGLNEAASANNQVTTTVGGDEVQVRLLMTKDGPGSFRAVAVDRARKQSAEATYLFSVLQEAPTGDWRLEEQAGSAEAVDAAGGAPAAVHGGTVFGASGPGGVGDRAVSLDGAPGTGLSAGAGLVDTRQGFSVSAWVRLTDKTRSRVAVSTDGSGEPGFTLGYDKAADAWSFQAPVTDVDSLGGWQASGGTATVEEWAHLIGVFDAEKATLQLYVNGVLVQSAPRRSAWKARGALQIGRRMAKSGYTDEWKGELAEVRVFDRMVVPYEIAVLFQLIPRRQAYWQLNDIENGISPEFGGGQGLALSGGPSIYLPSDPFLDPPALVGDGHLELDGQDDYGSTTGPLTPTDHSYTVTARVRLVSLTPGRSMTVFAQAGVNTSAFRVRYSVDADRWELVLPHHDVTATAPEEQTTLGDDQRLPTTDPSGQFLAIVYDDFADEVRLYVDGQLADQAVKPFTSAWPASGGFQVGRARVGGTWSEYFQGAIDDVRVYSGVADQTMVQLLSQPVIELPDL